MTAAFLRAFAVAFLGSGAILAVAAAGVGRLIVPPQPERFATGVFSFDLPPGWTCQREGTEHVCRVGPTPMDAVVILTMKIRSGDNTLAEYEEHLRKPMPAARAKGTATLVSLRRRMIAGTEWVEGVLDGSEVPGWRTTYLAGNTAEIAILVTFSVHERFRDRRRRELDMMMESLLVYQRGA